MRAGNHHGDIETFNPITPALAECYRLIGIDSRGQGKSTLGHLPLTCELTDRVANARLLNIAFTGHSPHEDHPQWLMPALKKVLGL